MYVRNLLAAAALLGCSFTVTAESMEFEFDKSHADITFRVSHLGYSSTHGRFNEFSGTLKLDPDNMENSTVSVSIDTSSVETSFAKRNEHLRSADFFNVGEFPEMTFSSTAVEKLGDGTAKMVGDLTLLGTTRPVTLELVINKIAPHPRNGKLTAGFTATGIIKRSEWGMDKFVPGIADDIQIHLDMEASRKEG